MVKCGFDFETKRCNKNSSKNRSWCKYNKTTGYCKKSKKGVREAPKGKRLAVEIALQQNDFDAIANILEDHEEDIKTVIEYLISNIEGKQNDIDYKELDIDYEDLDTDDSVLEDEEWGPFVSAPEIKDSRAKKNWKKIKPMVKFISAAQTFTDIRTELTIKHLDLSLNSIMQHINEVYIQIQMEVCQETKDDDLNIECQILQSLYQGIIQEGTEISVEYRLVKDIIDSFVEKIQEIYNIFYEANIPVEHPVNKFIEFVQEDYVEYANALDRFSSYGAYIYENLRRPESKHNIITTM